MPVVTQHAPGTFSWPELASPDPKASLAFYTALFGWTVVENDMGPNGIYYIYQREGKDAGAMFTLSPEMKAQGVPPNWGSYITVPDVDAAAAKAVTLGGKVLMGPMDVMTHGRMVTLLDPLGASFTLWQAKQHIGIGVHGEPGSLGWTQLNATDPEKAKAFYTALIGWTFRDDPNPMGGAYTTWLKSDGMAGGMMPMPAGAGAPSHWLVYWAVADVDASHGKALTMGAKAMVPPTDIPGMGRFSVLADPQGAMFALVRFNA